MTHNYKVGDLVRLVPCRGHVKQTEAGRLFTIRGFGKEKPTLPMDAMFQVRVDDGDPKDPDPNTNGFHSARWLPFAAIEPLRGGQ